MNYLGKPVIAGALFFIALTPAVAKESARINAENEQVANSSFKKMMKALPQKKQQELAIAMLQLNMAGKNSVYDVMPGEKPSAGRIKDRIAGMSADEIIELSRTAPDVKTKVKINPAPWKTTEQG